MIFPFPALVKDDCLGLLSQWEIYPHLFLFLHLAQIEKLNFQKDIINQSSREFNRKVRNIWNLNFQKHLISKYCMELGIKLIEVLPIYSSFIGNIQRLVSGLL